MTRIMGTRWFRKLGLLLCACIVGWGPVAFAQDRPEHQIMWMHPDFPPINIMEGPLAGQGVGDRVLTYFQRRLAQYDHKLLVGNFKRIIATVSSGQQACGVALLKNDQRAKTVLFSEPYMLAPHNEIIVMRSRLEEFEPYRDQNGAISLVELLSSSGFVFGYSMGRSYSSDLDDVLKSHLSETNAYGTYGHEIFAGLIQMLDRRRFDYTIGYGYEARYLQKQLGLSDDIVSIPVREHAGYTKVYVGCPKTPWGERVIGDLNAIILKSRHRSELYGVYKPWLDEQSWQRYVDALPTLTE
ncbi:TIGR02285 family protein [Magnetovibrio sp. PR-2]|uniref:TIGR02285 family protein n=1 Tax=Magnetovibrio sp. PR-2 TaxID=3120356 RepID=UPI002FCDF971